MMAGRPEEYRLTTANFLVALRAVPATDVRSSQNIDVVAGGGKRAG